MTMKPWSLLSSEDPQVFSLIEKELIRQREGLELIASENFASRAVLSAMGSILSNKYAEGLPGKRYYGGCEIVDQLEDIAIERAKKLFNAAYANVQPHSGAQANASVFLALLEPADKILGLDLSQGGHLTHGSKVNFSGILYQSFFYGLNPRTEQLDYDDIRSTALKIKPKMIIAGASAYPRAIDFKIFRSIADEVGAYLVVDMAHIAGLVAADVHQSPIPWAHVVTTTTHKTLRGPRGGLILWNDEKLCSQINKGVFPGTQGGPLEHVIAGKAVCFKEAASEAFVSYQKSVIANSKQLAASLIEEGFRLVSGGTDNHLLLMNLLDQPVTGKKLEETLGSVAITANKNTVPNENRSPFVTSGLRLGTPAVTSRGMGLEEMRAIASLITRAYRKIDDSKQLAQIRQDVIGLASRFPLYQEW